MGQNVLLVWIAAVANGNGPASIKMLNYLIENMKTLIVYFRKFLLLIVSELVNRLFKKDRSLQECTVTDDILFV